MSAEILATHTPALFEAAVRRATELLRAGGVVALPTETVYGLAANAFDSEAVHRIYALKGRPAHNPIIVHVASRAMAKACAAQWPAVADRLADAYWPGPLTIVVPRAPALPDAVTAGGETVGIRWPQHPFIQAVIRECGFPLAAPSANLSNRLSPTNARHVAKQLGDRLPLIVDGGDCNVGIESTVVDVTSSPPRVLRPGIISSEAIQAVVGPVNDFKRQPGSEAGIGVHRSPGMLAKHYAPRARLRVLSWRDEVDLVAQLGSAGAPPERVHVLAHSCIPLGGHFPHVSVIPHDAEAFARALYAELHRCDDAGAEWIVVEAPPSTGAWEGIADRLRRAGGGAATADSQ